MKNLTIIQGPQGSGKNALANVLAKDSGAVILDEMVLPRDKDLIIQNLKTHEKVIVCTQSENKVFNLNDDVEFIFL